MPHGKAGVDDFNLVDADLRLSVSMASVEVRVA
jgi:hypothetical protein